MWKGICVGSQCLSSTSEWRSSDGHAPNEHKRLSPCFRTQAAVELCWLTCVSSALNGEELTRCGGVATLGQLLTRAASVLPADVLPMQPGAAIATHCLRTFAGMAAFASARADLAER